MKGFKEMSRPYQWDAFLGAADGIEKREGSLIVMATGTGKTFVAGLVSRLASAVGRVLFLTNRDRLVRQASEEFRDRFGLSVGIEQGQNKSNFESVVVASVNTLYRPQRLRSLAPRQFSLLVIDEAHHDTELNRMYSAVRNHILGGNPDCGLVGLTATPVRLDGVAMGQVYPRLAYNYDLLSAVRDAWLVRPHQCFVRVRGLNLQKVSLRNNSLGEKDYNGAELERQLLGDENLHRLIAPTVDIVDRSQGIIFCAGVRMCHDVCDLLNSRTYSRKASVITQHTPQRVREDIYAAYEQGDVQLLVGCDVFTEGFDSERVTYVVNAAPTASEGRYLQRVGRGCRPPRGLLPPDSTAAQRRELLRGCWKPECYVIDLVGDSFDHKARGKTALEILGGNFVQGAWQKAEELAIGGDACVDVVLSLEQSQAEIDRQRELAERAERLRDGVRRKYTESIRVFSRHDAIDISLFHSTPEVYEPPPDRRKRKGKPATEYQKEWLKKRGVDATGWTANHAGKMIAKIRLEAGAAPATEKQKAYCKAKGIVLPENATVDVASLVIDCHHSGVVFGHRGPEPGDFHPHLEGRGWRIVVRRGEKSVTLSRTWHNIKQVRSFIGRVCVVVPVSGGSREDGRPPGGECVQGSLPL